MHENESPHRGRIRSVRILIITYNRPDALRRLLQSLQEMETDIDWRATIVDNDPDGTARPVIPESAHFEYVLESTPGIPAARNRSLERYRSDDDAVVFVDDDETVGDRWLDELADCAHKYDADVVAGPVISVFPPGAPRWAERSGYYQRRIRETGDTHGVPATNNTMVRTAVLRCYPIRFDPRYTLSGGSDIDFFLRLATRGVTWVWCRTAPVYETVQSDRISRRWIFKRYVRGGELYTRFPFQNRTTAHLLMEAAAMAVGGLLSLPLAVFKRSHRRNTLVLFARPLGIVRGLAGRSTAGYARPDR